MKNVRSDSDQGNRFASRKERAAPHSDLAVKEAARTKKPSLYKVFILNDDYTPMDFVVEIIESIFAKSRDEATRIMLHVHRKGAGLCGVYPYDIAETKATQVVQAARASEYPLQCKVERE